VLRQSTLTRAGVVDSCPAPARRVVIFCESWPVLLFVLPGLRLQCLEVLISTPDPPWLSLLRSAFPQVLFTVDAGPSVIQSGYDPTIWVLLHGSVAWASQLHPSLWLSHRVLLSYSFGCEASATDCHVSARDAGSVVDGIWSFRLPTNAPMIPAPTMYHRSLRHIVDPTTRFGTRCKVHGVPLDCTEALPMSRLHHPVRCHSVFRPGGWMVRPMSCVELGRALDLPPWVCSLFAKPSFSPFRLPWLSSPPLKVLHHVGCYVFGGGGR
jgi:hypothetical protein